MRRAAVVGLAFFGLAQQAFAADMPDVPVLRGSQTYVPGEPIYYRWDGLYVGGQFGYSSGTTNFSSGVSDLIANMMQGTLIESEQHLSAFSLLSKSTANNTNFGGFVGYNAQWDDAVVSVELNYTHSDLDFISDGSLGRIVTLSDGYRHSYFIDGHAQVKLTDYGTMRLRGGWAANWLMPYGFIGLAVARYNEDRSATVSETQAIDVTQTPARPPLPAYSVTQTDDKTGHYAFGYSLGAGVDLSLMQSLFLRGEYEFTRFGSVGGSVLSMNTVRAGIGYKF